MPMKQLSIPPSYSPELEPCTTTDQRPDAEILASLRPFRPVHGEKNIWGFWHSGVDSMPAWCQRNVVGWVRMCGPEWTVRILDNEPESRNYALRYLPEEALPRCFVERTMESVHSGQHASDFVRTACVLYHGGAYLDVGIVMIRHIDRICWDVLMDESNPFRVCVPVWVGTTISNGFIVARKGDPFIRAWHTLFTHLWRDRTTPLGLLDHPLISALELNYTTNAPRNGGNNINVKVDGRTGYEYMLQMVCWIRLCRLDPPPTAEDPHPFSPAKYWRHNILLLPNVREMRPLETFAGFEPGGKNIFELLRTKVDGRGVPDERASKAEHVVWKTLARGSVQKVGRATTLTVEPSLGILWDRDPDADYGEGTLAELLRVGAMTTRQKRDTVQFVDARPSRHVLRRGLLEPGPAQIYNKIA